MFSLDSSGKPHYNKLEIVKEFFLKEQCRWGHTTIGNWTLWDECTNCPQQVKNNTEDCGVFTMCFVDLLSTNKPLSTITNMSSENMRNLVQKRLDWGYKLYKSRVNLEQILNSKLISKETLKFKESCSDPPLLDPLLVEMNLLIKDPMAGNSFPHPPRKNPGCVKKQETNAGVNQKNLRNKSFEKTDNSLE